MIGSSTSNNSYNASQSNDPQKVHIQEIARLSQKLAETMDVLCQYQSKHSHLLMTIGNLQDRMKQLAGENDRLASTVTRQAQQIQKVELELKRVESEADLKMRDEFEMKRELVSSRQRIADLERLVRLHSGK